MKMNNKKGKGFIKVLTITGMKAIQKYVCQPERVKQTS